MEKYIEDTLQRALALRKNAQFALDNALQMTLSELGVPSGETKDFSIRFNESGDNYDVLFKGTKITKSLDGLYKDDLRKITGIIDGGGDLLLPNVDFIG